MKGPADPGWRIVELSKHEVKGPVSDADFAHECQTQPKLAEIALLDVKAAWEMLRRRSPNSRAGR